MKHLIVVLTLLALCTTADAARRKTFANGSVLIERGRARVLARTATEFNGVTRYGRAFGGGSRGFAAAGGE